MSKLMLKLYLDDTHVGYQKKDKTLDGCLIDVFSKDLNNWWEATDGRNPIKHDSFRQGIELPDGKGWLFDGDKVKQTWEALIDAVPIMGGRRIGLGTGYQTKTVTGTLHCDNYGWYIEDDNPSGLESRHMFGGIIWTWEELTLVTGE